MFNKLLDTLAKKKKSTFVSLTFIPKQGVNKENKYVLQYIMPFLLTS